MALPSDGLQRVKIVKGAASARCTLPQLPKMRADGWLPENEAAAKAAAEAQAAADAQAEAEKQAAEAEAAAASMSKSTATVSAEKRAAK